MHYLVINNSKYDLINNIGHICCFGKCYINGNDKQSISTQGPNGAISINCDLYIENLDEIELLKLISKWTKIQRWFLVCLFGISFMLLVISFIIYFTNLHLGYAFDIPNYFLMFRFTQNFGDVWTDIFFTIVLYFEKRFILFVFSLLSIGVPFILSSIIGILSISKWKLQSNDIGRRLYKYLKKYEAFLLFLTIFVGFYSAVDLACSRLFYLNITNFSLKQSEYAQLKFYRLANIFNVRKYTTIYITIIIYFNIKKW